MNTGKTLVLGASEKTDRYSNKAIRMLRSHQIEVEAIGNKAGTVLDVEYGTEQIPMDNIETVTLYLNPTNQIPYYDYILSLNPKRIIYNPGTENETLMNLAAERGIENVIACTLVLLATGQY